MFCFVFFTLLYNMQETSLEKKPSYYIVLRRSSIIAGLKQVEIMVIMSSTGVGDTDIFTSKLLCKEVDRSHLINRIL